MQPEELYQLDTDELPETGGPPAEGPDSDGMALLVYLEGFMDAGAAGRLLTEHLLDAFEHTTVGRFNTDRLLDYRSRRPLMTFDGGKWENDDERARAVAVSTARCGGGRPPPAPPPRAGADQRGGKPSWRPRSPSPSAS